MEVEFSTFSDKRRFLECVENHSKAGHTLTFSASHKIPDYAKRMHKYYNRLAAIIRRNHKRGKIRTKVHIPRGQQWFILCLKLPHEEKYKEIGEHDMAEAKRLLDIEF